MPSHWPTGAQREQWGRLADARRDAEEVCAGLRGKAKMACVAAVTGEKASTDE